MILIGKLTQGVIYEGIGALCFACGRVDHRRDGCPYVVRSPDEVGNVQQQKGDRKETLEAIHDTTEEDGYGPWMVVSRKKAGPRRTKLVEPTIVGGNSSSSLAIKCQWEVVVIPNVVIDQIRAKSTEVWGWFDEDQKEAWRNIFPFTPTSKELGFLPFMDPTWHLWPNP
nr:hypothetical protein CFP56_45052 [Quercus suber]